MKIVDARSGKAVQIGQTIKYPWTPEFQPHGPEWIRLVDVRPGIWSASAIIQRGNGVRSETLEIPLVVRWTHPSYFLQHVAFLPT
ncbi:MAG: hypothetical protein IT338_17395 [Thermomicrobiales bacterium]|nr:hypothetical protein [Thermomicrobiales bacterium]